jgi:hypothetical protein
MISTGRKAFTLLEVTLALALSILVVGLVSVAIHVHLGSTDQTRIQIERDQLARTLLRRIGDDLRGAVRREPFDDSGIMAIASQGMQDAAGKLAGSAGKDDSSKGGGDQLGQGKTNAPSSPTAPSAPSTPTTPDGAESETDAGSGAPAAEPGLYGSQYELQIDVGRIPRPDEFEAAMLSGAPLPSDVKTVTYFVADQVTRPSSAGRGLMRSTMNRASALWAAQQGDFESIDLNAESLAEEVVAVEFRYFDGYEWFSEWNSQTMKGLPLAIEVLLMLVDPKTAKEAEQRGAPVDLALAQYDPDSVYRTIVHLPNAQPAQSSASSSSDSSSEGITDLSSSSNSSKSSSDKGGGK